MVSESEAAPPEGPPERASGAAEGGGGALRRLALRGSLFELGGYFAQYALRFASMTVLRALLFPAAFGVMQILDGINIGLVMLSDVGIQQAVIQSKRGDEAVFLDTAWTLHAVRSVALWAVACLLAFPVARIVELPELLYYVPVASFSLVLAGFCTTAEFTLRRRMSIGRLTAVELTAQLVSLSVTITWSSLQPSVWALVAGGLASSTTRLLASHLLARHVGHRNRFAWDAKVRTEIFEFGKWITGSSAVFFVGMWADRLMLVALLGTTVGGVYATAVMIAEVVGGALDRVIHGVFYPLFSRVGQEGIGRLREVYYATRLRFDALTMTSTGVLVATGPWIISFVFDARYAEAGWMLRILALRSAMTSVFAPAETCLTSLGHSRFGLFQNVARATWILVGVPLAFSFWGVAGVVWVTALSLSPSVVVLWPQLRALGILRLEREALAWAWFALGLAVGYAATFVLPDAVWLRDVVRALIHGRGA